jgi:hypothetical protein
MSLPKLKKKLEAVFNAYIRKRDSEDGYFVCISCKRTLPVEKMNAGHFFPVKGFDGIRFDEDNVHGECQGCNCFNDAHLISYSHNLQSKIGQERYNALRQRADEYKARGYKWSRIELEELIEKYKQKL